MLTNREFSEKLKIPIGKVRRNTKELLGEDPRATRRSGYGREFTVNEGFYVFLGGILVSNHGLTFGQARDALETIKPWLLANQLVPEPPKNSGSKGVDEEIQTFTLSFYLMEGRISKLFGVHGKRPIRGSVKVITEPSGRTYQTNNESHFFYFAEITIPYKFAGFSKVDTGPLLCAVLQNSTFVLNQFAKFETVIDGHP